MFDKYIMSGRRRMFLKKLIWMQMLGLTGASLPWQTFTGNPLQFNAPKAHTLKSVKVEFEPKQEGSGDPSPDNVRPISGYTGLELVRTGSNLLDDSQKYYAYSNIYLGGAKSQTEESVELPAGTYYFNIETSSGNAPDGILMYDISDGSYISGFPSYGTVGKSFTLNKRTKICIRIYATAATSASFVVSAMLNVGSTELPYAPYDGETYEVTFGVVSANQWNEDWEQGVINVSNGNESSATNCIRSKTFSKAVPNAEYYVYCGAGSSRWYLGICWYDANQTFISGRYSNRETVTAPANAAYFKITANTSDYIYGGTYLNNIAINYPSTVTTYNPHSEELYGGSYNFVTGELTGEWATVDPSTLSFTLKNNTANRQAWIGVVDGIKRVTDSSTPPNAKLSEFKAVSYNDTWLPYCVAPDYGGGTDYPDLVFCFPSNSYTTEAEVQAAMSGVQLVYELATPVTYHLPSLAEAIRCFKGINTMWTDADTLTVEARAEAVNLSALQSLNMLLGGRYVNNHTEEDLTDEEALDVILGGQR